MASRKIPASVGDFAIYIDIKIDTSKIRETVMAGMTAAAMPFGGSVIKKIFATLAARLITKLTVTSNWSSKAVAEMALKSLQSLLAQPGTGRVYTTEWRTNKSTGMPFPLRNSPIPPHQSSEKGHAPAPWTWALYRSIRYVIVTTPTGPVVRIGTSLMYGRYLELGGKTFAPRPWLRIFRNNLTKKGMKGKIGLGGEEVAQAMRWSFLDSFKKFMEQIQ